ncbi:MAG: enoyl-CoA hydratase/isomerase family protein [Chloroflexi bacterium]|nr:enoyl-CoA hydratase/isomerase family protein [Chloroflexota bacterium]
MSVFETVLYNKDGDIAYIALNRPRVLNAYNMQMRDDMYEVLRAVQDDPEVRCVVLRGEGDRAFCTGADLTEFGSAPSRVIARQVRWERDVWSLFLNLDKPVIAALHGYVVGSGLEMALLCDLRIAADDAVFWLPEAGLGMLPAAGGSQSTPRIVGVPWALDMLLGGQQIDAQKALEMGLVHRVVSREHLLAETLAWARQLAERPPHLIRAMKEAIRRGMDMPLESALEMELTLAASAVSARE